MKRKLIFCFLFSIIFIKYSLSDTHPVDTNLPTYQLILKNDSLISAKVYKFEIWISSVSTNIPLNLRQWQAGIVYNTSILNNGSITATLDYTGSVLLAYPDMYPQDINTDVTGAIKINTKMGTVNSHILIPNTGTEYKLVTVILTNSNDFNIEKPNLSWNFTTSPYPTKVFSWISNSIPNAQLTLPNNLPDTIIQTWHKTESLNNPTLNQAPLIFNVKGTTKYCSLNGGSNVFIENSENDVYYQLYKNDTTLGIPKMGISDTLKWLNNTEGVYTISAFKKATYLTLKMADSAILTEVTGLPENAGVINGNFTICPGNTSEVYNVAVIPNSESYIWNFDGNGILQNQNNNYLNMEFLPNATSGTLKVKGKNLCGVGAESTASLSIIKLPEDAGQISGKAIVCQGENNITYSIQSINNSTQYLWTLPSDVTGVSSTNTIVVNFNNNAVSGNITVKGSNECGEGLPAEIFIQVDSKPDSSFAGNSTVLCNENTFELNGNIPLIGLGSWSLISGPNTPLINDTSLNNALVSGLISGNYLYKWSIRNGVCPASESQIEIYNKSLPIISANINDVSCYGNNDGNIILNITNTVGNINYLWNNGISTQNNYNLTAGIYTVNVTDSINCSKSESFTIQQPDSISVYYSVGNVTHTNGNDGSITVTITGGIAPYNYLWNDSNNFKDRNNINPGNYNLEITDSNLCNISVSIFVDSINNKPQAVKDEIIVLQNTSYIGSLGNNDSLSIDGGNIYNLLSVPLHGNINIENSGNFSYLPNSGYIGVDSCKYALCDNENDCDSAWLIVNIIPHSFCLSLKVILQGPYDANNHLMWDSLRVNNLIPQTEPYSDLPYSQYFTHKGGGGNEIIADPSSVFGVSGNNAIIDWIFIELRDMNNNKLVKYTKSALLQRDGDIVDTDGISSVCFNGLEDNRYFVAVRHRNHFGVMTANYKTFAAQPTIIDLTNGYEIEFNYGNNHPIAGSGYNFNGLSQYAAIDGKRVMWCGNINGDRKIKYESPTDDQSYILLQNFLDAGNTSYQSGYDYCYGYFSSDVDLNGKIKYEAPGDDQSLILLQVLMYPLNTSFQSAFDFLIEQLPY